MTDVVYTGIWGRWMSTTQAGELLRCTSAYLRKLCRGDDGGEKLPHRQRPDGSYEILPGQALDFIRANARRLPPGLVTPPADYRANTPLSASAPAATPAEGTPLVLPGDLDVDDPHELLQRILFDSQMRGLFSPQQILAFRSVANELRLKRESEAKAAVMLKPETVVEMLEDQRALIAEVIDDCAGGDAADLLKFLRQNFDVDLIARNVSAAGLLEVFLREHANKMLQRLNARVEEQVKGVRTLEFSKAPVDEPVASSAN